jgi:GNAT superfamily N-acetyltransferase
MSIELRVANTDEELEAWRRVRIALVPNERTASVQELRRLETPERQLLLAELDGEVAGSGVAGRSDLGGGFLIPRVLLQARRRGIGTQLLRMLAAHLERIGYETAGSDVEDEGSRAFAERFGFRETGRQVEQVRAVGRDERWPTHPAGIELVSVAERPELRTRTYHELALEAFGDMPTPRKIQITLEQWEREWITWPEGSFVALCGDEIVGCAGLIRDEDRPGRAENSLTAVRRDWRGRGLARALKEQTIAWASENGLSEIYTWTQTGNEGMRTVNEKLGYVTRDVSISVRAPLPLSEEQRA